MDIAPRRIFRGVEVIALVFSAILLFAKPLQAQSINPVPDIGNAVAGIVATPIADVAANDTVNGAPATLGAFGNATVAQIGTWPNGIALDPSSGAVTTTAAVPPATYTFQYQLCDLNSPPDCASTTDVVTVTASIVALPDAGNADAGIVSRAIVNVAANDMVNGAPATLGTSGNARVAQAGTWPTGITLNRLTASVNTTATVPTGIYDIQYDLCDRYSPPDCSTATDTVTVIAPSIVANADAGTAPAGAAATPVANAAANDTVNGAAVRLAGSPNASVAPVGTWPAGIALNSRTGAVTTTASVSPGDYGLEYQLCDKNLPPACAAAAITLTVNVSIVANPVFGGAVAGAASTPIANVAAHDTINGSAVALGTQGNATVAQVGTWPTGLALNTTTGAVSTTASVAAATYPIQYQLCDTSTPANCSSAAGTVLIVSPFTELQASADPMGVMHFDWARDGIYCPTCNYGNGNARFNWTDGAGNLWVGHMDPATGAFTPASGNNELADTSAFDFGAFGNGPDFAFSTPVVGQDPVSQLVYTRYTPGQSMVNGNAGAGFATPVPGGWSANFLPGAMGSTGTGPGNSVFYQQSQCISDPVATTLFYDLAVPSQVFTESVTEAAGTAPTLTPFGAYATFISGGKPGARWVPCTHQLVFVGAGPPDASGHSYQQVFWYDTDTQGVQQLTIDSHEHAEAFMFQAPEFGDNYVVYTVTNSVAIDIYEQNGVGSNGAPLLQLVNHITSPDPTEPYIDETEPFINCTPNCQTYIFMKLKSTIPSASSSSPNGLAVTNINPAQPLFKILIPQWATPDIQRMNPKYFITANGPYLYFARNTIASPTTKFYKQGRWYIDMQLGIPSGPCVGSSAESGMLPGC